MFLRTYKSLPTAKAERFKELSLKVQPTAAEKAELDKIRSDAIAEDKVYKALQTKSSPTPEEVKQLEEMGKNTQALSTLERTMAQQFDAEVNQKRDGMRDDVLVKIRASVQEVAKKQGYSIVFVKDVVPYGANDLTPEALKVLNTKK
jgi:Skp family chaperone for outer membrane proteins